jgi:hypothetical protein
MTTKQTDYAAVTASGDLMMTFSSSDLMWDYILDHPWLTPCVRTINIRPMDRQGRFASVQQGARA